MLLGVVPRVMTKVQTLLTITATELPTKASESVSTATYYYLVLIVIGILLVALGYIGRKEALRRRKLAATSRGSFPHVETLA